MKYCPKCKKEYDTKNDICPACGEKLIDWKANESKDELDDGELVAIMTAIGLF